MMRVHELKTWPEYFEPVWDQWKTFEIRYDDRAFQPADEVVLREFAPHVDCECLTRRHDNVEQCAKYTGRFVTANIGHITASTPARGNQRGFRGDGYVVFSLVNVTRGGVGKDPGSQDAPDPSDAPSPVSDGSLPSVGRPATTTSAGGAAAAATAQVFATGGVVQQNAGGRDPSPATPAIIPAARARARGRAFLESRVDEHVEVTPPRVAYTSGGDKR